MHEERGHLSAALALRASGRSGRHLGVCGKGPRPLGAHNGRSGNPTAALSKKIAPKWGAQNKRGGNPGVAPRTLKRGLPGTLDNTGDRAAKRRKTTRGPTKPTPEDHLSGPLTGATRPSNPWPSETSLNRRSTVRGPLIRATRPSSVQGGRIVNKGTHGQPSLPPLARKQPKDSPARATKEKRRGLAFESRRAPDARARNREPGKCRRQHPRRSPPAPGPAPHLFRAARDNRRSPVFGRAGDNACSRCSAPPGSREREDRRECPRQRGSIVIVLVIGCVRRPEPVLCRTALSCAHRTLLYSVASVLKLLRSLYN
ncbi:hypothetical protein NDU88_004507 [Pleurodeles waltl]|uniref:Uncharacterized protein n=1 Tax=Pleurodeles waltl TaxID=8319 RepID=A0AAV7L6X5_PLEWA|nr:hypothetical protein NDU88_004507 [Pleurodeles waltl]